MPCQISILCFWTHIQKIGALFLGMRKITQKFSFFKFSSKNQQFNLHFWLDFFFVVIFQHFVLARKFKVQKKPGETGSEPVSLVVLNQSKWRGAPRISCSVFLSFLFGIVGAPLTGFVAWRIFHLKVKAFWLTMSTVFSLPLARRIESLVFVARERPSQKKLYWRTLL